MTSPVPTRLSELTTLRLGGPMAGYAEAETEAELIDAVHTADDTGEALLILGGGSNLVVADAGFPGIVVRDARSSLAVTETDHSVHVTVAAGTAWDSVVAEAVDRGWAGIEALSGIPGSTGATPVQNVGAYGQEVADVIDSVRCWDRDRERVRVLSADELGFGYRTSMLKRTMVVPSPRWLVLDVTLRLRADRLAAPVRFGELSRRLGVDGDVRVPIADVRAAVLELRTAKGMVAEPLATSPTRPGSLPGGTAGAGIASDHDTWSAGSFFTNPIVTVDQADALPEGAPRYPVVGLRTAQEPAGEPVPGLVKTSAAWLIEHAGFGKGYRVPGAGADTVSVSTKHTLALTNRGHGTTSQLLELARTVRGGVFDRFGVLLVPEPVLVGCELDG